MSNNTIEKSKKYNLQDSITYANGSIVSKIVQKSDSGNITLFAFDEKQNLSEHTAPFDAIIQIIEGKARVIIDGKVYNMLKGECIIMPANIPHAVEATTAFKMLLTMIKE